MSNTTRKQPEKIARVLYFHNGRVVRVLNVGKDSSDVKHHGEFFTANNSDLFVATGEECKAYLAK